MQTWSAKLVHLVGFHFRTHTLKPFRTERAIKIKPLIACYIIVDMYEWVNMFSYGQATMFVYIYVYLEWLYTLLYLYT